MRRVLLLLLGVVLAGVAALFTIGPRLIEHAANKILQPAPYFVSSAARQLHDGLFVADMHADPLLWGRDLLQRSWYGHVDIPRLIDGGVALQVFGVVTKVPSGQNYESNDAASDVITALAVIERWPIATWTSLKARALYQAGRLHDFAARSGGRFTVIESRADLERYVARREKTRAITAGLLDIEGLQVLEGDLANLDVMQRAGFRMMGLEHFFDNELGGSAHGTGKGGLTEFGKQVVRRMEAAHIIVDLAHASPRMIDDVLAMATRPLVVSHTGVKGTCDTIRNLSDDHVRRVAATGGVIGIGYWDAAVCDVSVAGIVRAIQYTVQLAGVDHVALGSDFNGATVTPFDTTGVALITEGLLKAGFSDDDIAKIMGGNVVRLLRESLPSE